MALLSVKAVVQGTKTSSTEFEIINPKPPSPSTVLEQRVDRIEKEIMWMKEVLNTILLLQHYGGDRETTPMGFSRPTSSMQLQAPEIAGLDRNKQEEILPSPTIETQPRSIESLQRTPALRVESPRPKPEENSKLHVGNFVEQVVGNSQQKGFYDYDYDVSRPLPTKQSLFQNKISAKRWFHKARFKSKRRSKHQFLILRQSPEILWNFGSDHGNLVTETQHTKARRSMVKKRNHMALRQKSMKHLTTIAKQQSNVQSDTNFLCTNEKSGCVWDPGEAWFENVQWEWSLRIHRTWNTGGSIIEILIMVISGY